MQCRGVKKQNSVMSTSSMKGVFFDTPARTELLQLINNRETFEVNIWLFSIRIIMSNNYSQL